MSQLYLNLETQDLIPLYLNSNELQHLHLLNQNQNLGLHSGIKLDNIKLTLHGKLIQKPWQFGQTLSYVVNHSFSNWKIHCDLRYRSQ